MTTLKNVLRINAVSSGVTGIGLAVMPEFFANLFEVIETAPFLQVGIFLAVYGTIVGLVSIPTPTNLKAVQAIVVVDALWVVTSFLLILAQPFAISLLGNVMIAAVALWVFLMGYLQHKGAKAFRIA